MNLCDTLCVASELLFSAEKTASTSTHCLVCLCLPSVWSVCVYLSVYLCVCMYVCMHACMYVCMYVCMYACMYVCLYVCMYVCMYACMYVCLYACMYVCMYVCMHTCMHACIHTYIHTYVYTYMHTYTQAERVGVLECLQALGRALPRKPLGAPALSVVETVTGIFHFHLLFFLGGLWCLVPRTRVMYPCVSCPYVTL
jgi:hypothetical protein